MNINFQTCTIPPHIFDNNMETTNINCNSDYKCFSKDFSNDNIEYPDLPNATEIDDNIIASIVDNIEYLVDTEVFMDSVSSFEQLDNTHFVPANMDIINHSVFNFSNSNKSKKPTPPSSNNTYTTHTFELQLNNSIISPVGSPHNNNNNNNNVIYSPRTEETITTPCSPESPVTPESGFNFNVNINSEDVYAIHNKFNNLSRGIWNNTQISDIINKNLSITQLVHYDLIKPLISDQNGSRYLQRLLKKSKQMSEVQLMINYCINKLDLCELSEDVYGNYIVQLFFMKTTEIEHKLLLDSFINSNFLRLSKSMYGCRVIQKCLLCITKINQLHEMAISFEKQTITDNKLAQCLICPYTNHVIQAIFDLKLDCKYINFIKCELEQNLSFYCEHIIGCRVIQNFIKNYGDKLNILSLICNDNHLRLSKLKYGNYVIQCIIESNTWYSNLDTIIIFKNKLIEDVFHNQNILYLSKNKFGSNVVEKCIQVSNKQQKLYLFNVLTNSNHILPSIINHCYGNYVIKALLNQFDKTNKIEFIKAIKFYCKDNIIKKDLLKQMNKIQHCESNNL